MRWSDDTLLLVLVWPEEVGLDNEERKRGLCGLCMRSEMHRCYQSGNVSKPQSSAVPCSLFAVDIAVLSNASFPQRLYSLISSALRQLTKLSHS